MQDFLFKYKDKKSHYFPIKIDCWLVGWILWYINLYENSSISNNLV